MRAGIIQSCYFPWRGYFDFIASVDVFVLFDDVAFGAKGNWRHRNQLRFGDELRWLSVPVRSHADQPIDEVEIAGTDWVASHRGLLKESLGRAPFYKDAARLWEEGVGDGAGRISVMNARITRAVCAYLGIGTRIVDARPLGAKGAKTERLLDLLKKLGADHYVSGPTARGYLDEARFRQEGIRLDYKAYDYAPYPQQGEGFQGTVMVLDLIANVGPAARAHLRSRVPDQAAVA